MEAIGTVNTQRTTTAITKANLIAEIAGLMLIPLLLVLVVQRLAGDSPIGGFGAIWAGYLLAFALIAITLRMRGQTPAHLGLRFGRPTVGRAATTILLSIVVFVVTVAAYLLGAAAAPLILGEQQAVNVSGYDFLQGRVWVLLLSMASVFIVSSFGEELIFRGFLMTRLKELVGGRIAGWMTALALSAIMFGLAHFAWGPAGMIQTLFMGVALGASFLLVKRNLWVVVLAHAYMDAVMLLSVFYGI